MQVVLDFFSYINDMGASVMMPVILTIFGVILGAKFGKALRGGLTVGVGFIGLNIVIGLMGNNLAPAVQQMTERFGLSAYNCRRRLASMCSNCIWYINWFDYYSIRFGNQYSDVVD